jgi:hypothetical protein
MTRLPQLAPSLRPNKVARRYDVKLCADVWELRSKVLCTTLLGGLIRSLDIVRGGWGGMQKGGAAPRRWVLGVGVLGCCGSSYRFMYLKNEEQNTTLSKCALTILHLPNLSCIEPKIVPNSMLSSHSGMMCRMHRRMVTEAQGICAVTFFRNPLVAYTSADQSAHPAMASVQLLVTWRSDQR